MATIEYRNVNKVYPGGVHAVRDLDLQIADGEFMVIVGPSGCGKTTAMRMCAGLEEITRGELFIDDVLVNDLQPQQRNVSMVFQNYALYPHMSVRKNLAFPLQMRKLKRPAIAAQVEKVAQMLELGDLLERKPKALSGGQRQRVAMGRALVRDPVAFLMDEPLSNLDAKLRVSMRAEISQLQRRTHTTTIYVTHDQIEAMTMGDRVAVMRQGLLQQVAPPQELYDAPVNTFVASFIGSPSMNLFRTRLVADAGGPAVIIGDQRVAIAASARARFPDLDQRCDGTVSCGLRPEAFVPPDQVPAEQRLRIVPDGVEPLGHEQMVYAPVPVQRIHVADLEGEDTHTGEDLRLVTRLPGRFGVSRDEPVELGVDTAQLHLFDDSGCSLATAPVPAEVS
ncbi:MAG: ABC transporter ATP-binding protein [Planctomycetota bacterium]